MNSQDANMATFPPELGFRVTPRRNRVPLCGEAVGPSLLASVSPWSLIQVKSFFAMQVCEN